MHIGPGDVVGPGLDQRQVERPEALANLLEPIEVAGIATEEYPHILVDDHPRRPQGPVAVQQPTPGKVLSRGGDKTYALDLAFLPPVQLPHLRRCYAPGHQQVAYAQRRQEHTRARCQLANRLFVQMIEVIVGQYHRSQRRQLVQRQGRRMEAQWAGPLHRRGALGEYRVGNKEAPAQLEQHRGMAQAPKAAVGRIEHLLTGHGLEADRCGRPGFRRLAQEQVLEPDAQLLQYAILWQRRLVVKAPFPLGRRLAGRVGQRDHQQHSEQQESLHVTPQ
ncbi:hypothetical protein D3C81_1469960 [compost metagenome]